MHAPGEHTCSVWRMHAPGWVAVEQLRELAPAFWNRRNPSETVENHQKQQESSRNSRIVDLYTYWHSTLHTKRSLSLLTQYCTHQEIPILTDTVLYTPRDPYPYWHSTVHTKRSLSLLTQYCTHQEIPILTDTVLYTPRDPYPYWHSTVHTKRSLSLLTQYCTHQEIPILTDTVLYTPRDPYPYWHSTVKYLDTDPITRVGLKDYRRPIWRMFYH